jgi:hypothetical protein
MLKQLPIATLVVAAAAFMAPIDVRAQTVVQNASGVCQGALPVYATNLRNRPLGIKNEGASGAYVSCSVGSIFEQTHAFVRIQIANLTGAAVDVSCTIITGRSSFDHTYYPVSLTFPARRNGIIIQFLDRIVDPATDLINASCLLPPGVELSYIATDR